MSDYCGDTTVTITVLYLGPTLHLNVLKASNALTGSHKLVPHFFAGV
jgi:hypothetical protein